MIYNGRMLCTRSLRTVNGNRLYAPCSTAKTATTTLAPATNHYVCYSIWASLPSLFRRAYCSRHRLLFDDLTTAREHAYSSRWAACCIDYGGSPLIYTIKYGEIGNVHHLRGRVIIIVDGNHTSILRPKNSFVYWKSSGKSSYWVLSFGRFSLNWASISWGSE